MLIISSIQESWLAMLGMRRQILCAYEGFKSTVVGLVRIVESDKKAMSIVDGDIDETGNAKALGIDVVVNIGPRQVHDVIQLSRGQYIPKRQSRRISLQGVMKRFEVDISAPGRSISFGQDMGDGLSLGSWAHDPNNAFGLVRPNCMGESRNSISPMAACSSSMPRAQARRRMDSITSSLLFILRPIDMEKSTMGRRLVIEVVPGCQARQARLTRIDVAFVQSSKVLAKLILGEYMNAFVRPQGVDGLEHFGWSRAKCPSARHVLNVAGGQSRRLGLSTFGMIDGLVIGILASNGQGLGRFDTPLATLFASNSSMVAVGTNESQTRGLWILLLLRRRRRCRGRKILSWKRRFIGGLVPTRQHKITNHRITRIHPGPSLPLVPEMQTFVPKARRPRFDLKLKIYDLNNVPLVSGTCFVKWHLPSSSAAEHRGRTAKCNIKDHKVVFDYEKQTPVRLVIGKDQMLQELWIHLEIIQEYSSSGKGERITLGNIKLNLAEYVDTNDHNHDSEEGVTRRYLMQDSKINSTLKISLQLKHLEGDRNYYAPPLRTAPVFGGIAGIMSSEVTETTEEGSTMPSLLSKSREHGELQDMYRRTLAASWVAQPEPTTVSRTYSPVVMAGAHIWTTKSHPNRALFQITTVKKPSARPSPQRQQRKRTIRQTQSKHGTFGGRSSLHQQAMKLEQESAKRKQKLGQHEVDEFDNPWREDMVSWKLTSNVRCMNMERNTLRSWCRSQILTPILLDQNPCQCSTVTTEFAGTVPLIRK
ncbi:hypothetical protein KCU83_g122, partial [Aureobasidium melanogenum]